MTKSVNLDILVPGEDSFTSVELFQRALEYKGLELQDYRSGDSNIFSKPFRTYAIDSDLIAFLDARKIERQFRPDVNDTLVTFIDNNYQESTPGWSFSNNWKFRIDTKRGECDELKITLRVNLEINNKKRGIVFKPRAFGTFVSPCDELPHLRMFKAMVESDSQKNGLPIVAKEIAASKEGSIVVTWTELGLGGIRRLDDLFTEFSRNNDAVKGLARRGGIFSHAPYQSNAYSTDKVFVIEPAQAKLFEAWRKQLEEYRDSLVIH